MKKILLLLAIVGFASCNSDDDSGDANINEFESIKTTLPQGTWIVSKLIDGQTDHSPEFESFIFTFKEDGSVDAQNDLLTVTGTWIYDDSSSSGEDLVLQFSETPPFDELNDDWDIVSVSGSKIDLMDVSSSNGDTELLTFTKL